MKLTENQKGFTIPELITVILISGILSGLMLVFLINVFSTTAGLESDTSSLVKRLNANDYLREEIGKSSGLITQNSIADINVGKAAIAGQPYWKILQPAPTVIIANGSGGAITPVIYFKKFSLNSTGNYIKNGTIYYEDEFIMYMDNSNRNLYVRTLANPSATGNVAKRTCPPSLVTSNCPSDRLILEDIADVTPNYISKSGNQINYYSSVDPLTGNYNGPSFPLVEVVELNLHVYKEEKYNRKLDNNTLIRVALRNI